MFSPRSHTFKWTHTHTACQPQPHHYSTPWVKGNRATHRDPEPWGTEMTSLSNGTTRQRAVRMHGAAFRADAADATEASPAGADP